MIMFQTLWRIIIRAMSKEQDAKKILAQKKLAEARLSVTVAVKRLGGGRHVFMWESRLPDLEAVSLMEAAAKAWRDVYDNIQCEHGGSDQDLPGEEAEDKD